MELRLMKHTPAQCGAVKLQLLELGLMRHSHWCCVTLSQNEGNGYGCSYDAQLMLETIAGLSPAECQPSNPTQEIAARQRTRLLPF